VGARLIALVVLTLVAVGIALVLQRRRPDPPSAPSYRAPTQLDRDDFPGAADSGVLVALFSSTTCDSCPQAWSTIESVLAAGAGGPVSGVTAVRLDVQSEPDLHRRYRIDGVPTTVVTDDQGVVVQAFFGPLSADQLTDALASAGIGP
jgi:hypothetical protein